MSNTNKPKPRSRRDNAIRSNDSRRPTIDVVEFTPNFAADCLYAECSKKASVSCPTCSKLLYCSRKHLKLCNAEHVEGTKCVKYKAAYSRELGKHFIATKDITPTPDNKQVNLWSERPKIFAPYLYQNDREGLDLKKSGVCILCCGADSKILGSTCKWDTNFISLEPCQKCRWYICAGGCKSSNPGEVHQEHWKSECEYLQTVVFEGSGTRKDYDFLLLFRLITLKNSGRGEDANIYNWMLDRFGQELPVFEEMKKKWKFVIEIVRNQFNVNKRLISDEEIIQLIQIIQTKFYDAAKLDITGLPLTSEDKVLQLGHGLYELGSSIIYSCMPNCSIFVSMGKLAAFITAPVKKGDVLTASYDIDILLWPTRIRRDELINRYAIRCHCLRCRDPTELGTFFSGIPCNETEMCKQSKDAFFLPKDPLNAQGSWTCNKCQMDLIGPEVHHWLAVKEQKLNALNSYTEQNQFLKAEIETSNALHWNHYLAFETSMKIMEGVCNEIRKVFKSDADANVYTHNDHQKLAMQLVNYRDAARSVNTIMAAFLPGMNHQPIAAECRVAGLIQIREFADLIGCGKMTLKESEAEIIKIHYRDLTHSLIEMGIPRYYTESFKVGLKWLELLTTRAVYDSIRPKFCSAVEFIDALKEMPNLLHFLHSYLKSKGDVNDDD